MRFLMLFNHTKEKHGANELYMFKIYYKYFSLFVYICSILTKY